MWGTSSFPPWNSTVLSSFNQKQLHPMSIPSFWGGKNVTQPPPPQSSIPRIPQQGDAAALLRVEAEDPNPSPPPPHCSSGLSNAQEGLGGGRTSTASISDKESSTQNSWQTPLLGDGSRGLIPPIPELTFQSY